MVGSTALRNAVLRDGWICQSCLRRSAQASRRSYITVPRTRGKPSTRFPTCITPAPRTSRSVRSFSATPTARAAPKRRAVLPDTPARTRFAPSPTGYLHIGGLRTALFSYLLAKRTGGQFLLRIEDTDQKRLVPGAEERLLSDLQWAGIEWDEGPVVGGPYGPYKQSERNAIYQRHAQDLLEAGAAYRCFCTPQTAGQGSQAYVTSGCYQDCASVPSEQAQARAEDGKEANTIRLKRPADAKKRTYPDLIYGKITPLKRSPTAIASASVEGDSGIDAADTILVKSDGTPTYHFANVVDDHLMKITHVIRGTEWMASTPLHYDLYHAFGWTPPAFAHVGLLVDENKAKLSKRNSDLALDVSSMRDVHGVLPETLANFLALLGWSNATNDDVMDMQQLIQNFDLKFTKGNTMVRTEKLWYLQKHHVARRCSLIRPNAEESYRPIDDLNRAIAAEARKQFADDLDKPPFNDHPKGLEHYCSDILLADSKSYQNAKQYVHRNRYFFVFDPAQVPAPHEYYDKAQTLSAESVSKLVEELLHEIDQDNPPETYFERHKTRTPSPDDKHEFEAMSDAIHARLEAVTEGDKTKQTAVMRYLREKLSYGLPGPSIGVVMAILGREECRARLDLGSEKEGGW